MNTETPTQQPTESSCGSGTLYVVATPIGHRGDLSQRAIEVLQQVDLIAAEDTRHSARLCQFHDIRTHRQSLHQHNEHNRSSVLIDRLLAGESIALISDAGTPLISDPGYPLVHQARMAGVPVIPVPGACAAIAALSVSGMSTDEFVFRGFLPSAHAARQAALAGLARCNQTQVFYESSHRIAALLDDMRAIIGPDRRALIAREMTKRHEQYVSESLEALCEMLDREVIPARGEFVVVLEACPGESQGERQASARDLLALFAGQLPDSRLAALVARHSGLHKKQCYEWLQGLKKDA